MRWCAGGAAVGQAEAVIGDGETVDVVGADAVQSVSGEQSRPRLDWLLGHGQPVPGVQSSLVALQATAGVLTVQEALHREVGGPDVLRRQLQRLRELAERPNISLRVLPFTAGASPALSCPFTLLYIERARATIAYVETLTGSDYLRSTGAYMLTFDHCQRDALSEEDTRTLPECGPVRRPCGRW
jgi:hypothetical protein